MTRLRWVIAHVVALAFLLTMAFSGGTALGADNPPDTTITSPDQGQTVPVARVAIRGTATDDGGVAAVKYAVRDRSTSRWLQADKSWRLARHDFSARLAQQGARSTTWQASFLPPTSGQYALRAFAVDRGGLADPSPAWRRISVGDEATPPPAGGGGSGGGGSGAEGRGYLTILFGRALWEARERCRSLSGAVNLERVARDLKSRGEVATAAVIPSRVAERERACFKGSVAQASWQDLGRLRDQYGWTMVSNGYTHNNITKMTLSEQRRESCGSLTPLRNHGHRDAWGLFAYGANRYSSTVQSRVVSDCFAYGRTYNSRAINTRSEMGPPWFQKTRSVTGGKCRDTSLPCSTMQVKNNRLYMLPTALGNLLRPAADQWTVIQYYRLVSGKKTSGIARWDCTGSDARRHWTTQPEMYCYNDFLAAVDAIPAGVRTVDPATVARAWGRTP